MRVNPHSAGFQGLSTFLSLVALNILYLLACLPIVTIPAATAGLYQVTMKFADFEQGRLVVDFFPAVFQNFRRATLAGLVLFAPAVLLAYSGVFWLSMESVLSGAAAILAFLAAAYLLASFLYAMALVAYFEDTVRRTVRNALLLPLAEPGRTLMIVLIPVSAISFSIVFPPFLVLVGTIVFSAGAYGSGLIFRNVFARNR